MRPALSAGRGLASGVGRSDKTRETSVIIQINRRPSQLKAAQLGNLRAQLPADAVDHVEIIPNPSAHDDGVAGIIDIVLHQKPDAGTSSEW
jgi:hypothetical protein